MNTTTTLRSMIETLKSEINYCNNKVTAPMIISCPCVVATEDTEYVVGVKDGHATVEVGLYNQGARFTTAEAERLAREFHAENGYGKLTWKVFGWKHFYAARRDALQARLDSILSIPGIEAKMNIEF